MKKWTAIILAALLTAAFFLMALGSSSSSESSGEKKDTESASAEAAPRDSETTAASTEESTTESKKKDAYEVGEARAVTYTDSIGSVWAQVSVPVTNTGEVNLYLSTGSMDLEDESGHLVDTVKTVSVYPEVIQPGETAWYYDETTLDEAPSGALKVIPHVDVEPATVDCIRYEVSDVTLADDKYFGIKITGRVENTTEEDESMVYVVAMMYDENDDLLCQAFTVLTDELKAGDKIGFSMKTFSSNDAYTTGNVARYEVYAFPWQIQF